YPIEEKVIQKMVDHVQIDKKCLLVNMTKRQRNYSISTNNSSNSGIDSINPFSWSHVAVSSHELSSCEPKPSSDIILGNRISMLSVSTSLLSGKFPSSWLFSKISKASSLF